MFTTLNGTVLSVSLPFIFYFVWFVFLVCVYYVYLYMGQVPELKLMMMMMMIISGTGKVMDFKCGGYIHSVHPNKSPLKILDKGSMGVSRD